MIEWKAVLEAARQLLLRHAAPAGWKHRALSDVEQEVSRQCSWIAVLSKETLTDLSSA